ncbi:hypothetical protein [Jiella sonneratiae]|uniref:Uncharacterized protein n=1 Tax=Jiella sonneratiae TaxID=2816856 RepID=A0ABS3J217_9HYPH|nr:hypothetical protein [Jiella sonneratiae]MBO0903175.1 hypothetical protein [Jiella sonneratiae]
MNVDVLGLFKLLTRAILQIVRQRLGNAGTAPEAPAAPPAASPAPTPTVAPVAVAKAGDRVIGAIVRFHLGGSDEAATPQAVAAGESLLSTTIETAPAAPTVVSTEDASPVRDIRQAAIEKQEEWRRRKLVAEIGRIPAALAAAGPSLAAPAVADRKVPPAGGETVFSDAQAGLATALQAYRALAS